MPVPKSISNSGALKEKGAGIKVLLTHPGTQYSYFLAEQLEKQGILFCFATGLAFGKDSFLQKLLPGALRKKLQRRTVPVPQKKLFTLPFTELRALWRFKRGRHPETVFYERNKRFQQQLPQRLINGATHVIGFDTSSWILQERCRKAGKPFILDASIAHPLSQQAIFNQLRNRFPAWAGQLQPKDRQLVTTEMQEMASAANIVVASEFTRSTYLQHGIDSERIHINHYGTNFSYFRPKQPVAVRAETVHFLYFSKLSVRKGFPWLCEIWRSFQQQYTNARLTVAGYGELPAGFELPAGIQIQGFVHPGDRLALFHSADVFVFPSYFEGFAQVIIEAMACGLPVITTTNTVGPELITDGVEGFCVEPGDDQALLTAMAFFVENQHRITTMGQHAAESVKPLSWDAYGVRWKHICEEI